jgi:hypothetical protein
MFGRPLLVALGAGAIILLAAALVVAGPLAGHDLGWHVVAGGGGRVASSAFVIEGTAGQAAAGELLGEEFRIGSGFWGGGVVPREEHRRYLPLILRRSP